MIVIKRAGGGVIYRIYRVASISVSCYRNFTTVAVVVVIVLPSACRQNNL